MTADVMVIVERQLDHPQSTIFEAWTDPAQLVDWRGSPGWHVERETLSGEQRVGGRHHHVKVVDDAPAVRVTTDGVYSEFHPPHVFVSRERITGDEGIDPNAVLELRVELIKTGRNGTLVRIIQGPYEPAVADYHSKGWENELNRLAAYLLRDDRTEITR